MTTTQIDLINPYWDAVRNRVRPETGLVQGAEYVGMADDQGGVS